MPKTPEVIAAEEAEAKAAAEKAASEKAAADAANGFPSGTPLDQMTAEQREAYWKHQARKHEGTVKARQDYDQLKADSEELARLRAENATEQEKALEDARRDGENIGAQRYLKEAVTARFQTLTGKTDQEIDTIFAHVDPLSFTGTDGAIDTDALKTYAATFGKSESANDDLPTDPVAAALERQRRASASGGGGGGSIAELKKQRKEQLQKK